tara:strand:- start:996 stop:1496 length:501 start_codon:yes stop_codon:yes gene_type:complete
MELTTKEKKHLWYLKNKEKNKEHKKQYAKEWRQSPEGIKSNLISSWKYYGLKATKEEMDIIYDRYLNSSQCELCNQDYSKYKKCMDHSHETGKFRNIICHQCNLINPLDIKCNKNNTTTGHKNIYEDKHSFRFRKEMKGKVYSKRFKTLEEAIIYKEQFIINILCG